MAEYRWYNNGEQEIQFSTNKYDSIPDGFVRGRKPRSPEEIKISSSKRSQALKAKSQAEKDQINRKRSDSLRRAYLNMPNEKRQLAAEKRKATMRSKSEAEITAFRKKLSDATKGKNKGKIPWNKGLTKATDVRVALNALHTSLTNSKNCAELKKHDPNHFKVWRENVSAKMKQNNTYGVSSPEETYYITFVSNYGENNVVRQYRDERYPYDCDFYIPSEDLFIEINKHWTHGGRPYDPTDISCQQQLAGWQEKAKTSHFYQIAIYVWTDLDVRKQNCAKDNNLNYITIY